jgi:hypothetical protein
VLTLPGEKIGGPAAEKGTERSAVGVAWLGNPDPGGMKVYAPVGGAFDAIHATEAARAGARSREAA